MLLRRKTTYDPELIQRITWSHLMLNLSLLFYGGKLMVMIAAVANFPEICPLKKKEHTFA